MLDPFYTPSDIASDMLEPVRMFENSVIADFSVGFGSLLSAAKTFWDTSQYLATDADLKVLNSLKVKEPNWDIELCDFLDYKSRKNCRLLKKYKGKVSLVLLNPPYTCKGSTKFTSKLNNEQIDCSRSMAFLLNAINYLNSNGKIVALLPQSTLTSEKDTYAWGKICEIAHVEIVKKYSRASFSNCDPNVVIIKVDLEKEAYVFKEEPFTSRRKSTETKVKVIRGNVSLSEYKNTAVKSGILCLHTSDIQKGIVYSSNKFISKGTRIVQGPAVLVPRLGRPNINKIGFYKNKKKFMMTDWLIALKCKSIEDSRILHEFLNNNWDSFESVYNGTCASYTTISKVKDFLLSQGFLISESM